MGIYKFIRFRKPLKTEVQFVFSESRNANLCCLSSLVSRYNYYFYKVIITLF